MAYKLYGKLPYRLILLHGGPGAIGDLKEVADVLSGRFGVVEILNKGKSIQEQIEEIHQAYLQNDIDRASIAGHSWGAWLAMLFTLQYPDLVNKLILISCPSLDQKDKEQTTFTRISRLKEKERIELEKLSLEIRRKKTEKEKNDTFSSLGWLIKKADTFEPGNVLHDRTPSDYEVFRSIWPEAESLRRNGELKKGLSKLKVEVSAIHGDYDPHPAAPVETELQQAKLDFEFHLLKKCGHYPWNEKFAREDFFRILTEAVK